MMLIGEERVGARIEQRKRAGVLERGARERERAQAGLPDGRPLRSSPRRGAGKLRAAGTRIAGAAGSARRPLAGHARPALLAPVSVVRSKCSWGVQGGASSTLVEARSAGSKGVTETAEGSAVRSDWFWNRRKLNGARR